MKGNLLWALLIVGAVVGFIIGRQAGKSDLRSEMIDQPELVKEIAELCVFEVDGTARLTESNTDLSRTFWNDMGDFFGERTLQLDVPYQAKYGVDLAKSDIKISGEKKKVKITLEKPALKSLELRMDRMQEFSKNGLLVFQKDNRLKLPLQKLYAETKAKLANKAEYRVKSQELIELQLQKFYTKLGVELTVSWVN
jgi:hypothetical protein